MPSLGTDKISGLWPLWEKYGAAIVPAMFIDGELELCGGVLTKERIIEAIVKHGGRSQQVRIKPDNSGNLHPENERRV